MRRRVEPSPAMAMGMASLKTTASDENGLYDMEKTWESRAALYELLARTFLFTEREVAEALVSGDYGEALAELVAANNVQVEFGKGAGGELGCYRRKGGDEAFHSLRREYTRLYIGGREPLVVPFAGTREALEEGREPLLFVGKKSMEVERFMRACGVVHAGESNDPLDHIGSMLEFLMHLCMLEAELVNPPRGVEIPKTAYEDFYQEHFIGFAHVFAEETIENSNEEFFTVAARVLEVLPDNPL